MNWALVVVASAAGIDQQGILQAIRRGFQAAPSHGDWFWPVLGLVALAGLAWLGRHYFTREQSPTAQPRRDYLAEALDVLALSPSEREDLMRLASRARLPEPVAMLLSPANLAHAYARAFAEEGDVSLWARLDELSVKVYGEPLPLQEFRMPA